MYKVLAITGKSASGKDTMVREIIENYPVNKMVWVTTRPKRDSEIEGVDYYFDDDYSDEAVLLRNFNGWTYALERSEFVHDNLNVIIASPQDVRDLRKFCDVNLRVVHIEEDDHVRLLRSMERTPNNVKEIIRRFHADEEDFKGLLTDYSGDFESCWRHISSKLDSLYVKIV